MVITSSISKIFLLDGELFIILCSSAQPPCQQLHKAKTAIITAKNKIDPCPCDEPILTQQTYDEAKRLNLNGDYYQAKISANQVLTHVQAILRR